MNELNNRCALDRPWGPDRPIFGTIRTLSSENTARELSVKGDRRRFAPGLPAI